MNNENLRPFNTLSPEEHRKVSRIACIASGQPGQGKKQFVDTITRAKLYIETYTEELEQEWNEFQRWRRKHRRKKTK